MDGDKNKRQKEKETLEPNIVLPIRLATLKVRLKIIKRFLNKMLKREKSQLKLKSKEIKLSNDEHSDGLYCQCSNMLYRGNTCSLK